MSDLRAIIPGLAEAEAKQEQIRDSAFLGLPVVICGLPCAELTARRFAVLMNCRNPFVCGGFPLPEHIAQLLWAMDPEFSYTNEAAKLKRIEACKKLDYHECVAEIKAFVEECFLDAPPTGDVAGESFNSWMASLIDFIAREYGWSHRDILETPVAALFQYVRIINRRINRDEPQFNRLTDAARQKWLDEVNPAKQN